MLVKGVLAAAVILATAVAGCGGTDDRPGTVADQTPLSGNTSDMISGVTLSSTGQVAAYRTGRMPISTEQCPGSGSVETHGFVPGTGSSVTTSFGSVSGTAGGALVGVAGRWGYYELSTADRDSIGLEITFDPTAPATTFRIVVEPKIAGSLRAPYFVDMTPVP